MKSYHIKAAEFFDLLKLRDTSMWEIFSQMLDGEEKQMIFLDENEQVLFDFILPKTKRELEVQRKKFNEEFALKLASLQN